MNMHEWMELYSHRMAQWRTPESSGTGAACVPLDRSLMPTYSRAVEWIESQILVDVCSDLRPFCWNVHFIWQFCWQKGSRCVNMITDDIFFIYISLKPIQILNFVTWITAEHREFHKIQSHDRYAYSLAVNYAHAHCKVGGDWVCC